jgi:two-component sensor histidine kinase
MVQVVVQDTTESKQIENQIKTSLEEKEVLLKEIHHRVKNNLQIISSLLDLQSSNLDEAARRIFADCQNRINSMALIHEELYHSTDLAHVDFETYAGNLAESLIGTYGAASVGLELVVDALPLTLDKAIPMGLIINELVSNSLKHAFPGGPRGAS